MEMKPLAHFFSTYEQAIVEDVMSKVVEEKSLRFQCRRKKISSAYLLRLYNMFSSFCCCRLLLN
jgi:hypothetical protein